jgi:hypothetical protein
MRFNQRHVDSKVLEIDHDYGQYRRSPIMAAYHRSVLRKTVKLSGVQPGMTVLDYGCGRQMLKKALPTGVNYTGYDLVPEFSDVADPSVRQYDIVFAIQVLMYPSEDGLSEVAATFAAITQKVVIMVPSQTSFKRYFLDPLLGLKKDADETFRSRPDTIYKMFERHFAMNSLHNYLGVAAISTWQRRSTPAAKA